MMRAFPSAARRFAREETASTVVEMAIVAPVLFMLLFGIVEFGIASYRWATANEAARIGARVMMVRSTFSTRAITMAQLQDTVRTRIGDQVLTVDSLLWKKQDGTAGTNTRGNRVRVVVSYPSLRITRLFPAMRPAASAELTVVY